MQKLHKILLTIYFKLIKVACSVFFLPFVIHQTYLLNKICFNQLLTVKPTIHLSLRGHIMHKTNKNQTVARNIRSLFCNNWIKSLSYASISLSDWSFIECLDICERKKTSVCNYGSFVLEVLCRIFFFWFCYCVSQFHNITNSCKFTKLNLMKFKQQKREKAAKTAEMRTNCEFNFSFFVKPINFCSRSDWKLVSLFFIGFPVNFQCFS